PPTAASAACWAAAWATPGSRRWGRWGCDPGGRLAFHVSLHFAHGPAALPLVSSTARREAAQTPQPPPPLMRLLLALLCGGLLAAASFAQAPTLALKLSDAVPVEMPALHPCALYAEAAVDAPDTISSVTFHVGGTDIPAALRNGAFEAWWTPAAYGPHSVSATAITGNGESATASVDVEVVSTAATQIVATMDGAVINFDGSGASQWHTGSYVLPQSVGSYNRIMAHLMVTCPSVA